MNKIQVLICDDEKAFHIGMKHSLRELAEVKSAYNGDEALALLGKSSVDLVILDIQMRTPTEGLDYLPRLQLAAPDAAIVMNTSISDYATLREAFRLGASDYLVKDAEADQIALKVQQALAHQALKRTTHRYQFETSQNQKTKSLQGTSERIQALRKLVEKFRAHSGNVVIAGETGVGKEVVARSLRKQLSTGDWEPFVAVDSATIQSSTAESTLFGYEKGAFTGADAPRKGIFEEAHGGVVYFDEIANMPMEIQNKLLRVIQEKEVTRMGSARAIPLQFRVICATNRDLKEMCEKGQFKEDLYQRLNVLPLTVPPLRERSEDIPELVQMFLARFSYPERRYRFTDEALEHLRAHSWPGNVRELSNVVAYATAVADGAQLDVSHLPPQLRLKPIQPSGVAVNLGDLSFYDQVAAYEKEILERELSRQQGNVSKTAVKLGMDRSHLHSKLREYDIRR